MNNARLIQSAAAVIAAVSFLLCYAGIAFVDRIAMAVFTGAGLLAAAAARTYTTGRKIGIGLMALLFAGTLGQIPAENTMNLSFMREHLLLPVLGCVLFAALAVVLLNRPEHT